MDSSCCPRCGGSTPRVGRPDRLSERHCSPGVAGSRAGSRAPAEADSFSVDPRLLGEFKILQRHLDEVRSLARLQEAELLPRGGNGRLRSLERRMEQERLLVAQEATSSKHICPRAASSGGVARQPRDHLGFGDESPRGRRFCHGDPPWARAIERPPRPAAPAPAHPPRPRSTEDAGGLRWAPGPRNLPRPRTPRRKRSPGPLRPPALGLPGSRVAGSRGGPSRAPRPPHAQRAAESEAAPDPTLHLQAASPSDLQAVLADALRGLGGAKTALAGAARQLSLEAKQRNAEAWRIHRLEQAMGASIMHLGRELREVRKESARLRLELSAR